MKPLYAVSTSVGSGKTVAAVQYMVRPEASTQDFIYVAPTIRLVNQTEQLLRRTLESQHSIRSVHLIHSESNTVDGYGAAREALLTINEQPTGLGRVVFLTTATFIRILSSINAPSRWYLILDEAFAPVSFINYHLGPQPEDGLSYFQELFCIDTSDNYRVLPAAGKACLVDEVSLGQVDHCGQRHLGQQQLAQAVSNPAIRCELVVPRGIKLEDGDETLDTSALTGSRSLLFASYITPELFGLFKETIILSALFEHTVLHHLWSRCFGVRFIAHPWFSHERLRDVHKEQGPWVAVGHLLHQSDKASKHNLFSNRHTGKPGETAQGERVLDHLVNLGAQFLKGSRYLLQTNNGTGYGAGSALLPDGAHPIPVISHGLNDFKDTDNILALAVTNPNPQEAEWVQTRTGLTKDQVLQAYRIHTVYQAVGRTSIRAGQQPPRKKVFLVAGYEDARLLHQLFQGSTWLGQVGDQPPLKTVRDGVSEQGTMNQLAQAINDYLDHLDPDIQSLSSRSVKASVAPECAQRTWTEAARMACMSNAVWRKDGHRFRRLDHGFTAEEVDL